MVLGGGIHSSYCRTQRKTDEGAQVNVFVAVNSVAILLQSEQVHVLAHASFSETSTEISTSTS